MATAPHAGVDAGNVERRAQRPEFLSREQLPGPRGG
jgi:hypothetical protein